ncbi:hypothetical protein I858_004575 [Planococcus versutus]|uniref:Uncharacterized protein n=1 Tax=Planococcus versutus TaxID=1302659 RepID=A0A1B1RZG0_9BACL|nr:hypothetical protein I858_004575 [Planococcus versutus]
METHIIRRAFANRKIIDAQNQPAAGFSLFLADGLDTCTFHFHPLFEHTFHGSIRCVRLLGRMGNGSAYHMLRKGIFKFLCISFPRCEAPIFPDEETSHRLHINRIAGTKRKTRLPKAGTWRTFR